MIPNDLEKTVKEYKRVWPILTQLQMEIIGLAKKDAFLACAKRLGMLARQDGKKVVVFEHELESDVYHDYLIYMHRPRGISLVRQMLNRNRHSQGSDERRLLEAMVQARFSMFWVKELVRPAGFVGRDLLNGGEHFILDRSIAKQKAQGLVIGLRTFPYLDVRMHTGANLVVGRLEEPSDFGPEEKNIGEKQERAYNEEVIFKWREVLRSSF
ncbi:hypothetical protein SAMN02745216_03803 [Desulfatibacillum alkenivorans DSM 16219]|uniref:Uncharacterized protein n=1 Tax=Desulfatibacillum alkenivorans DSM 16219 TaxID=1121393 RepID=A0A1M6U3E8_9BACT|nr:hypothetical protein [Desulfatibacillum alkenivorans]SHK63690.1 hypothetical protein SAMN02745216_03803 [Desulfatibacillum alkenivorans DSM 16219]